MGVKLMNNALCLWIEFFLLLHSVFSFMGNCCRLDRQFEDKDRVAKHKVMHFALLSACAYVPLQLCACIVVKKTAEPLLKARGAIMFSSICAFVGA